MPRPSLPVLLVPFLLLSGALPASAAEPSFRIDVMAALSKAGCNQGTCHGNLTGKGGLRLSIRGEDWRKDFDTLTRREAGRRVNRLEPAASLLLLKPAMTVPHEGGRRFRAGDPAYQVLHDWIAAGAPRGENVPALASLEVTPTEAVVELPTDAVRLAATAVFADGRRRDVSAEAVYEPSSLLVDVSPDGVATATGPGEVTVTVRYLDRQVPVRLAFVPPRPDFAWDGPAPANRIDELVFAKLRRLKVNPAPVCDDATFLRRVSLDLLGRLPTVAEADAFLAEAAPDKRATLVSERLARPEFAAFWGLKWADLLRAEETTLDARGVAGYTAWINACVADGKPLDEFARELVAARGSTYDVPPANFYRAMRDPVTRAESVAQVFLGLRLQCAKCHNHPFDRWTQDDYYGWTNLFTPIDYEIKENKRTDKSDKHEFVGEQVVTMDDDPKPVLHPETGKPVSPRFLEPGAAPTADGDRLEQLAAWMTAPRNDQFARATANRVWSELLGRGIVDPIDDFRATNPPSNPELLDALAADLVAGGFDLRTLIREIAASRTYQLSSETDATNADDERNFSHALPRRLTAEQLLDAFAAVTGAPAGFGKRNAGQTAVGFVGVQEIYGRRGSKGVAERFLKAFGKPPRLQACACERTSDSTLAQTFQLVSGELLDDMLRADGNRLDRLAESGQEPAEMVRELYAVALTRRPTDTEAAAAAEHLRSAASLRAGLEDMTWALLNSAEFLLRP